MTKVNGTRTGETGLACAQVSGGNVSIHAPIKLPGLRGIIYSQPCDGGRGGDVHFASLCGSGVMSRLCVADVVGHGETVAGVSSDLHGLLRRFVSRPDQRRMLEELNRTLQKRGLDSLTTAAALTYSPPRRRLSYSYAGHPPGWYYHSETGRWERLSLPDADDGQGFKDMALAVTDDVRYTRARRRVRTGDRLVLCTDGVMDTPARTGGRFGSDGVADALAASSGGDLTLLMDGLLDAMRQFGGSPDSRHDDVTIVALEFTGGPRFSALWHLIRNRVLRLGATGGTSRG